MEIQKAYETRCPSGQNIVDLFDGEWSSRFPAESGLLARPGTAALFEDGRIDWAVHNFGGVKDLRVLELGPLEGGHTYMLHTKHGVGSSVSVEANPRAFLKCLCVKELFGLSRAEFKFGDFVAYMAATERKFDATLASGVLYHMDEPLKALDLMCRSADKLYIWTVYYQQDLITSNKSVAHKFSKPKRISYAGATYDYAEFEYKESRAWSGFCGGPKAGSRWLTRESILTFLERAGFTDIRTGLEQPDHPNGPAFGVCALR
jgi:hypothetical protein